MSARNQRRDYGYRTEITTRWADCDAYSHVNNAEYYSYFDTALTTLLIERGVLRSDHWNSIGLCVESHCSFLAPIEFPQIVEACVRIGKLGTKSIRYEIALFVPGEEEPAATGYFVHVFVDPQTRRPVALAEGQRAAVQDLVTTEPPAREG